MLMIRYRLLCYICTFIHISSLPNHMSSLSLSFSCQLYHCYYHQLSYCLLSPTLFNIPVPSLTPPSLHVTFTLQSYLIFKLLLFSPPSKLLFHHTLLQIPTSVSTHFFSLYTLRKHPGLHLLIILTLNHVALLWEHICLSLLPFLHTWTPHLLAYMTPQIL